MNADMTNGVLLGLGIGLIIGSAVAAWIAFDAASRLREIRKVLEAQHER